MTIRMIWALSRLGNAPNWRQYPPSRHRRIRLRGWSRRHTRRALGRVLFPWSLCVTFCSSCATDSLALSKVLSLVNLVTAGNSLLCHSHDLPLFNSNHCFDHDSTTHTPATIVITPLDLDRLHFFVHRLIGWTCVFRLLSNLPRSNPGVIHVHSRWYSGLFSSATLLCRSLSGRCSALKLVVAGALCTRHNPRPSAFTVHLSHGLGMQLCVGQQAVDNLSSGSIRQTGVIIAKRQSV